MTPGAVDAAAAGTRTPRAEVRLVHDPAEAADLVAEWDELAEACGTGPLSRPRYALGWWRTLGRGRLLLATARVDGRLVVLAPLHERRAWPVRRVRWLGHGLGTVAEMLVLPGHEDDRPGGLGRGVHARPGPGPAWRRAAAPRASRR